MTAIETLIAGLFDYAGLYPPASLDMLTAVRNYLRYAQGEHRAALGRFVAGMDRIGELRDAAGSSFAEMRLSVIVRADANAGALSEVRGSCDDVVLECKVSRPSEVERVSAMIGADAECYFEIPMGIDGGLLDAIQTVGGRVKLRMGGVVVEAFPKVETTASMLAALSERRLAFKATAGLHHPIRSQHAFTYEAGSATGTMHGFLNVAFAAALLHFGGIGGEALKMLEEEDPGAWHVGADAIGWRALRWSADQVQAVRRDFFISIGSCSFEEPIQDLKAMGWL